MSKKWFLGGLLITLAVVALSMLAIQSNSVYFYTPKEALAAAPDIGPQEFRVGGMVKGGSVQWEPEKLRLDFVVHDLQGTEIAVQQEGQSPPDMFKEDQGVVVEGRFSAGGEKIIARNLFVKHSEEYKAPDGTMSKEKELLMESIFKNQQVEDGQEAPIDEKKGY